MKFVYTFLAMLLTGIIGYIAGIAKSFREQKVKTYEKRYTVFTMVTTAEN